jgi:amino acid transporter
MSSTAPIQGTLSKDRLGVPSVVYFVMSAAAPLTVVSVVIAPGYGITGNTGIPVAFIMIAVLLALFSVGYVAMSRYISNAGAFYTYVTHGLGRPLGVGTAWMALLAYNGLQIGLYGAIGAAAAPLLEQWFDIKLTWWVIALVAWALVAILGVLRVDINGKVLAVLLLSELAIILIYDVVFLLNPADGKISVETLQPNNLFASGFSLAGAILVLAMLGFTGFETAVVFSEESRNPRRTIALATYGAVVIIGGLYALSAWAMTVATGPGNILDFSTQNGPEVPFALAAQHMNATFVDIGHVLFATSVLAAMISFHNTVARYTFALGRERVFPTLLSQTGRRSGAPAAASMVQSVLALVVILLYAIYDLDPITQLVFPIGTGGGFGVLVLIVLTSIAVIAFFLRTPNDENAWRRFIAPALAAITLGVVVYYAVDGFHNLLSVAPDHPLRWIIPALYPAIAVAGILWALVLRATRRDVYDRIGLGANTVTGLAGQSRVLPTQYAGQHGTPTSQRDSYR